MEKQKFEKQITETNIHCLITMYGKTETQPVCKDCEDCDKVIGLADFDKKVSYLICPKCYKVLQRGNIPNPIKRYELEK